MELLSWLRPGGQADRDENDDGDDGDAPVLSGRSGFAGAMAGPGLRSGAAGMNMGARGMDGMPMPGGPDRAGPETGVTLGGRAALDALIGAVLRGHRAARSARRGRPAPGADGHVLLLLAATA